MSRKRDQVEASSRIDPPDGDAMDSAALSGLIEQIYDCAMDHALWPSTLGKIAGTLDSPAATINVVDFVTGSERTLVHAGIAEHYQALYRERYQGLELFSHGMMLRSIDEPTTSDELVTEDELLQSRIYRKWAAPQGFRHVLLTALIKTQARVAFVGVTRLDGQRRYDAHDKARMALLAPHVRRAITIADLIDHKSIERSLLADVLDALATAVLVLDGTGRLVHANVAGEGLLTLGDVLVVKRGAVAPWNGSQGNEGGWSICDVVRQSAARTVSLERRDGGTALLSLLPLTSGRRRALADGEARVAVFVQDRAAAANHVETSGQTFGLTGGELRVLLGLSEGGSATDVATRYGIAPSTVRSHLKSLFFKTGVRRQKDLLGLLFASPQINLPPLEATRPRKRPKC